MLGSQHRRLLLHLIRKKEGNETATQTGSFQSGTKACWSSLRFRVEELLSGFFVRRSVGGCHVVNIR